MRGLRFDHCRSDGCRPDRAERVPACSPDAELPELAGARSGLRNTDRNGTNRCARVNDWDNRSTLG